MSLAPGRCRDRDVLPLDSTATFLVRSICRPFRARRVGWRFPGLKPWAESSSPVGAKTHSVMSILLVVVLRSRLGVEAFRGGPFGMMG
jgi:hypothetical protein